MNIFVDTCVWRDWLTFKNKLSFSNDFNRDNADTFNEIYKIVASQGEVIEYTLLYNALIDVELTTTRFLNELPFCFENIKGMRFMKKVLIPLTRADNIYKLDGSLCYGGRLGGTLRKVLQLNDQYDHEAEIKKQDSSSSSTSPFIKPRRKEFDLEHLESALEADADFFVTSDKKLIKNLEHTRNRYETVKEVNQALQICISPNNLLEHITKSIN